jgi:S-adenosyl-L-methionine hydrolase (adenosine-forming)
VEITSEEVIVQPVAPMFHARDILCPAAAQLSSGLAIEDLGPELDPATLAGLDLPEPEIQAGKIRCEVVEFNRFGNVKLNVREAHLAAAGINEHADLAVEAASGSTRARRGSTYADFDAGEYGVIFDPRGWLMVVRGNPASALEGLGLAPGDPVWISGPPSRSELVTP